MHMHVWFDPPALIYAKCIWRQMEGEWAAQNALCHFFCLLNIEVKQNKPTVLLCQHSWYASTPDLLSKESILALTCGLISATALATAEHPAANVKGAALAMTVCALRAVTMPHHSNRRSICDGGRCRQRGGGVSAGLSGCACIDWHASSAYHEHRKRLRHMPTCSPCVTPRAYPVRCLVASHC